MKTMTMEEAPAVGLPIAPPPAPDDCDVCQALARQRDEARQNGDLSRATDCNVEIRKHHTPRRAGGRK